MSEGPLNVLRSRATMEVNGATYTFPNTFLRKKKKKVVEQDIAKIAMKHISKKIRDEGFPLVLEVCYVMMANL